MVAERFKFDEWICLWEAVTDETEKILFYYEIQPIM